MIMKELLKKLGAYLKYPSTYKGLAGLLGLIGVALSPEQAEAFAIAGVGVYTFVSLLFSDSDVKK